MSPADIKELRDRMQCTQTEFARKLGLATKGAVSKLESGAKEPKGPLLELLKILGEKSREKTKRG